MNAANNPCFLMICSFIIMAASNARATTVTYTLDNVVLADGEQLTGSFDWTYSVGDFDGGSGVFTALEIPYTIYSLADGNLNTDIQTNSIEITGNGNYHDVGLDISLFLSQPLAPTQSASIDLGSSYFECCGNGFKDQPFQDGSIVPSTGLAGDYNQSGVVDAADYTVWRDNVGAPTGTLPNDATGGVIGQAQYNAWKTNFSAVSFGLVSPGIGSGSGAGAVAQAAVPEPATWLLIMLAAAGASTSRRWC